MRWGSVVAMVVVVRPSGGICKAGEWVCAKKAKTPKPSGRARFRVCRVKRQWEGVRWGGEVVL